MWTPLLYAINAACTAVGATLIAIGVQANKPRVYAVGGLSIAAGLSAQAILARVAYMADERQRERGLVKAMSPEERYILWGACRHVDRQVRVTRSINYEPFEVVHGTGERRITYVVPQSNRRTFLAAYRSLTDSGLLAPIDGNNEAIWTPTERGRRLGKIIDRKKKLQPELNRDQVAGLGA